MSEKKQNYLKKLQTSFGVLETSKLQAGRKFKKKTVMGVF